MSVARHSLAVLLGLVVSGLFASRTEALQFTPAAEDRFMVLGLGPGTSYANNPGDVDYDAVGVGAHPGEVSATGTISSLSYFKTTAPGTPLSHAFNVPIEFTLEAQLTSINVVPTGFGSFVTMSLRYAATLDGQPDLVVKDPTDNSVLLTANLVSGNFLGTSRPALRANFTFDALSPPTTIAGGTRAFFDVTGGLYSTLFDNSVAVSLGGTGFADGVVTTFSPNFNVIAAAANAAVGISSLISHTAEADGTVWALTSSQFAPNAIVPEPSTGLLVGVGLLAGLAGLRWTRR